MSDAYANTVQKQAAISLEIGKALVLSRVALTEVNESNHAGLTKMFATSNITPDNFICLLVCLRDTLEEVCRLTGVSTK